MIRLELYVDALKTGVEDFPLESGSALLGVGAGGIAPVGKMFQAKREQMLRGLSANLGVVRDDTWVTLAGALSAEVYHGNISPLKILGFLRRVPKQDQAVAVPVFIDHHRRHLVGRINQGLDLPLLVVANEIDDALENGARERCPGWHPDTDHWHLPVEVRVAIAMVEVGHAVSVFSRGGK